MTSIETAGDGTLSRLETVGRWLEGSFDDTAHEVLSDPALDGLDAAAAGFHELGRAWRGSPRPRAPDERSTGTAGKGGGCRRAPVDLSGSADSNANVS